MPTSTSGDPEPGEDVFTLERQLIRCATTLPAALLDHLVDASDPQNHEPLARRPDLTLEQSARLLARARQLPRGRTRSAVLAAHAARLGASEDLADLVATEAIAQVAEHAGWDNMFGDLTNLVETFTPQQRTFLATGSRPVCWAAAALHAHGTPVGLLDAIAKVHAMGLRGGLDPESDAAIAVTTHLIHDSLPGFEPVHTLVAIASARTPDTLVPLLEDLCAGPEELGALIVKVVLPALDDGDQGPARWALEMPFVLARTDPAVRSALLHHPNLRLTPDLGTSPVTVADAATSDVVRALGDALGPDATPAQWGLALALTSQFAAAEDVASLTTTMRGLLS